MADLDQTSILIVDDMPEKLLVYRTMLEELGQHLVTVPSGEDALKEILRTDFAVILLDVNMPGMDGFETARYVRRRKRSAHTPIIFLTAFADEMRTAEGYAHGAVDYLLTPVVPEILRAKVRVFVELFLMRRQVARQAEERARRAAAEEAARRSAFLADASRALTGSLDFEATLRGLLGVAVPALADLAAVTQAGGPSQPWRSELAWAPPGNGVRFGSLTGPDAPRDALRACHDRVLATGRAEELDGLDLENPLGRCDPEPVPADRVRAAVVLPLVARGRTLGALTLAHTRADRRLGPADRALAEDLAGRAAIALDNARLYRDIQDNDRRKNEFLAMLAHELRNPLAPVRAAVEVLRLKDTGSPELNWARDVIDRQIGHLARLVDDLLDVSRITRGKIQLAPEEVDVGAVVAAAVETSRPLLEARGHLLTVDVPDGPLRIEGDPARLVQVLTNLLNNAAKYTPEGGRVGLAVERAAGEVVFRVRDTGEGLAADMLDQVFDLFTQVDRSLDRAQGGLGIGLTLVRRLAEMHGGSVRASSDGPGRGSEFVVRLPLRRGEGGGGRDELTTSDSSLVPHPSPLKVLVVDDNADAAESLAVLLRLGGHEVRIAYDGPSAVAAAAAFRPAAVILDIGLPGLDGYEVARRLREGPATREALLVAVSGYGQEEDRRRSRQAGFDHHFIKPVDFNELRKALPVAPRAAAGAG